MSLNLHQVSPGRTKLQSWRSLATDLARQLSKYNPEFPDYTYRSQVPRLELLATYTTTLTVLLTLSYQMVMRSPGGITDSFEPPFYLVIAFTLMVASLQLSPNYRKWILPLIWFSIARTHNLLDRLIWLFGPPAQFEMYCLGYYLHSFVVMFLQEHGTAEGVAPSGDDKKEMQAISKRSFWTKLHTDFKKFNNPRHLTLTDSTYGENGIKSRLRFACSRLGRAIALYLLKNYTLDPLFRRAMKGSLPVYFAASRENMFSQWVEATTPHEFLCRGALSVSWIWATLIGLECSHAVASVLFVSVLGLEGPEEWPSLFGSPLEAYTVRRFWGRFWHKLLSPTYASLSAAVLERLGMSPKSTITKTAVALGVFTLSALVHALVKDNGPAMPWFVFYHLQFAACTCETFALKAASAALTKRWPNFMASTKVRVLLRILGYIWVMVFMYATSAYFQYPKLRYHIELIQQKRRAEAAAMA